MRALLIASTVLIASPTADADSRPALADPTSAGAREHLTKGNKLFAAKDYPAAINEYEDGALVENAPVFEFALGQCYRMLGEWREAEAHYRRFLALGDGHLSPKQLKGTYALIDRMRVELAKIPPPQPPPPAPTPPIPVTLSPPALAPQRTLEVREPWYHDRIGWGLTVVGVSGLAVGAYYLTTGLDAHHAAITEHNQARQASLQSQALTHYKIAGVVGGIGLGLTIAGAIKLMIPAEHQVQVTVSHNAVVLSGRF